MSKRFSKNSTKLKRKKTSIDKHSKFSHFGIRVSTLRLSYQRTAIFERQKRENSARKKNHYSHHRTIPRDYQPHLCMFFLEKYVKEIVDLNRSPQNRTFF